MLRMSGNYLVFDLWAFLLCLLGCQPAQLKNPEQTGLQNASTQTTLLNLPDYPALEKTQTEGQVHISGQTVKLELKLPTADPAFKTQLLDLALAGKITASVKDSYGKIYYPVGADASHQVDYPVSGVLSLTFNNVVPDPLLFVKVQVLDTSPADIVQADLAAVLRHTGINNACTTLNFYTTALAKTLETLLGTNATRARSLNLSTLDTLMTSITGRAGSIPNYTYTSHPSLVKTAQLASDLVSNEPGTLTAATYRGVGGTANLTVSGLLGTDKLQVQITDAASVVKTNLGNGSGGAGFAIDKVTPGTGLNVKVRAFGSPSVTYTYTVNPNILTLTEAGSQTLNITATPNISFTSFSPAAGTPGSLVMLTGTGFTGTTAVNFNGLSASFTVVSDTQINATVPTLATEGLITVVNGSSLNSASAFDVQRRMYVKSDATGANNGTTWANAYPSLHDAMSAARTGDELWVAKGTYKPFNSSSVLILREGVKAYGGLAGSESSLDNRNFTSNEVIISGDFGNDDTGSGASYTVVGTNNISLVRMESNSTLDGFTLKGANGASNALRYVSVTGASLKNLHVLNNTGNNGGVIQMLSNSELTIENSRFEYNQTINSVGGNGGAIHITGSSTLNLTDVVFANNTAHVSGGGIYQDTSGVNMTRVSFLNNQASDTSFGGGGILVQGTTSTLNLDRVSFVSNRSPRGGGLRIVGQVTLAALNTVWAQNAATSTTGGGIMITGTPAQLQFFNVTFADNTAVNGVSSAAIHAAVSFSADVRNGLFWNNGITGYTLTGSHNLSLSGATGSASDPFINSALPLGADGNPRTSDDGLRIKGTASSVIDLGTAIGTPANDILDIPRNGNPEPGAYEYLP